MSKLMELVDDYGILRYRLACIGERNRASLAARADERKAQIRAAVAELERDAATGRLVREKLPSGYSIPVERSVIGRREIEEYFKVLHGADAAMEADK